MIFSLHICFNYLILEMNSYSFVSFVSLGFCKKLTNKVDICGHRKGCSAANNEYLMNLSQKYIVTGAPHWQMMCKLYY